MKILFSGGGTMGSVTPLLSVIDGILQAGLPHSLVWVGTYSGPERRVVQEVPVRFIPVATIKWRRYWSMHIFALPFVALVAFLQALWILLRERPDVLVTAGGYVSVPIHWIAWFLRIPSIVHQQDIHLGLANRLMLWTATRVTSVLADTPVFSNSVQKKLIRGIGNPIRSVVFIGDSKKACTIFSLEPKIPTVLVMGGGTGAQAINILIRKSLSELLSFCQIVHVTGVGKEGMPIPSTLTPEELTRYHAREFIQPMDMAHLYAASVLVISRAGFAALSELGVLGKPTMVIPIPNSHQEANAEYFARKDAVVLFEQDQSIGLLVSMIRTMLQNLPTYEEQGRRLASYFPRTAADRFLAVIESLQK